MNVILQGTHISKISIPLAFAVLTLFTGCKKKTDTSPNSEQDSRSLSGAYQSAVGKLTVDDPLSEWQRAIDAAIPVERYATNRLQRPINSTDPKELRLSQKTKLKIGMPWYLNGEMAPFFVAQSMGYYEAVNLEIEMLPGGPGIDHSLNLLSGNVDIALVADPVRLLSMITSVTGADITCIGALYPSMPTAFIGLDSEIPKSERSQARGTVADLSGSYLGILPGYDDYLDYLEFKYGGEHSFDRRMRIGGSMSPVMLGKIDWAMGWISFQAREMEREGFLNWKAIYFRDVAFDLPSDIIVAKGEDLQKRRLEIEAFLWATAKGKAYQIDNPAEAAAITNGLQPRENVVSDAYLIRRFELEAPTFHPQPGDDPLYMNLENWSNAFAELSRAGVLE